MMKNILLFTVVALVVIACGNANSGSAAMAAAEEQPSEGAKIYKQYCLTCHGLYGDMGASGAAKCVERSRKNAVRGRGSCRRGR